MHLVSILVIAVWVGCSFFGKQNSEIPEGLHESAAGVIRELVEAYDMKCIHLFEAGLLVEWLQVIPLIAHLICLSASTRF